MSTWRAMLLGAVLAGCDAVVDALPSDTGAPVRPELPAPASRAPRLSHAEYEHTVSDLLGTPGPSGITGRFVPDLTTTLFDNAGGDLSVTATQWTDYQSAAEELSARATATPEALARVLGDQAVPADALELVGRLARRVLRRRAEPVELEAYAALFAQAPALYPGLPATLGGARLVLEALLQSPGFLYRVELSRGGDGGTVGLSGPELASRLSYALWQSAPDAQLLDAAEDGSLLTTGGYRAQVSRLLSDARLRRAVQAFHAQLLGQGKFADITRSATLFPEFSPALPASLREEQVRFVDDVVLVRRLGLGALLTAPETFVDRHLARVYGLPGDFDDTFRRVSFTDGRRAGLFTQLGFLASQATSTESDPIHRGVFINQRLLCAPLPPPPNMVPALPAPDPAVPQTLRERVHAFTGPGTCGGGCHANLINPVGFAYEHYDALGRWRELDNGLPVDARAQYTFDGRTRGYDGAVEFAHAMAAEPATHRCYTQRWLQFLLGRDASPGDAALVQRVGARSHGESLPVTALLELIVQSDPFRTRAPEELP